MDKLLDRLANLALVVICVVAVYVAVHRVAPPRSAATAYEAGDKLDVSKLPWTGTAERALLVVTRSGCHFCTESLPFYKRLSPTALIWIAVGEDAQANRSYLEAHGLKPAALVTADEAGLSRLNSTPQLILVSKTGRVLKTWIGKLSSDKEQDVVSVLKGA